MSALCFFIYLTLCVWTHFPFTSVIDKQREREKHRTKLASVLRQTTSHVGGNWRTRRNPTHTRREHAENTQNNQFLDYYSTYNRWHSSYHRHQTCFNITASGTESKQTVTVDQFYLQNIPCGQLASGHQKSVVPSCGHTNRQSTTDILVPPPSRWRPGRPPKWPRLKEVVTVFSCFSQNGL